jgi:hypothetical protein
VSTPRPALRPTADLPPRPTFVLYVEGPRDRGVLEAWAHGVSRPLARALSEVTVILGGCRPARAAEHFRGVRAADSTARALCVLDRDDQTRPLPRSAVEPGLDFFTWGRRHIESYLLVATAIRRSLRLGRDDGRVDRFLRSSIPLGDEAALREIDAKAIFAAKGPLARCLGRPVLPPRVARAMQEHELHADVLDLLGRLRRALAIPELEIAVRARSR